MNKYLYLISFLLIIIIFIFVNKYLFKIKENYCYIPKYNPAGVPNNFEIEYTYSPQSNINNSNCDKYWKKYSYSANSYDLFKNYPIPVPSDQLNLPVTSNFGNKNYAVNLIDYKELAKLASDKYKNYLEKSKMLNIDPITKKSLDNYEKLEFKILMLNKKTMKNNKEHVDEEDLKGLDYKYIKSPIEDINILNRIFLKKMNDSQLKIMNKFSKLYYGLKNYYILNYNILNIMYYNGDKNIPVYIMAVSIFRSKSYFINTYAYIGLKLDNKYIVSKIDYIGIITSSEYFNYDGSQLLNSDDPANDEYKFSYNYLDPTFVLNKNFNDFSPRIKNSDEIVKIEEQYKDKLKLENQYACFNINPDAKSSFLPYMNKDICESPLDAFSRPKPVGVFDKPCQKDNECPFFNSNKNYDNEFGKCVNNKCELPINMVNLGYHYYHSNSNNRPLCYNCDSKYFNLLDGNPQDCCSEQFNKKKYPFLKSPDYAFNNDNLKRKNAYLNKFFRFDKDGNLKIIKGQNKGNIYNFEENK